MLWVRVLVHACMSGVVVQAPEDLGVIPIGGLTLFLMNTFTYKKYYIQFRLIEREFRDKVLLRESQIV